MQLVVMAAVLALAGAEQDCSSGCRPKNISLPVDTCGTTEFVDTTICEGQCFQKDPNFVHTDDGPKQKTCNGEWSYEVKYTEQCPRGFIYPVARKCECTACNANTDCGTLSGYIPSC
ncbi:follitropin subunit beta [Neolamprologus brichardi]|uniref:Gonadotropin subunit beta-1-like n=1 Tax=Neolamprologus brichardi TaxID=32507 RepID=A0A3Q4N2S6_NEOBR|nr:follitropin subunit beta [Neolamprologus brichardi]